MIVVTAVANMMETIFSVYLQWFFRVSGVLFLGVSQGTSVCVEEDGGGGEGGECFYKVVSHRASSCIQVVLLCWCFPEISYYLGATVFQGIFQWLFVTFIYHYIYIIIHFRLVFVYTFWGFQNCRIRTLLQCPVLFSLIWLICYYRLIYLVLFNYRSH